MMIFMTFGSIDFITSTTSIVESITATTVSRTVMIIAPLTRGAVVKDSEGPKLELLQSRTFDRHPEILDTQGVG